MAVACWLTGGGRLAIILGGVLVAVSRRPPGARCAVGAVPAMHQQMYAHEEGDQ
jgi:hypothetical protein